jgi:hypothetical protein
MMSKQVTDRVKSSESVQAALRSFGEGITAHIEQAFGDEAAKACTTLLARFGKRLDDTTRAMEAADDAHIAELGDDAAGRHQRDTATEVVYGLIVDFRGFLTANFDATATDALGLQGETPHDPQALLRMAHFLIDQLPRFEAPKPRFPGVHLDKNHWLEQLRPAAQALDKALGQVRAETRDAQATQVAKDEAIATYDRTFSLVATFASALLQAAGQTKLASQLRPSAHRPGQTQQAASTAPATPPAATTAAE